MLTSPFFRYLAFCRRTSLRSSPHAPRALSIRPKSAFPISGPLIINPSLPPGAVASCAIHSRRGHTCMRIAEPSNLSGLPLLFLATLATIPLLNLLPNVSKLHFYCSCLLSSRDHSTKFFTDQAGLSCSRCVCRQSDVVSSLVEWSQLQSIV